MAADNPGLATWIDIGDSWKKVTIGGAAGCDLRVLILTNKARPGPKPIFFLQAIAAARYSLDAPARVTGTTTYSLTATDGAFDSFTENVQAALDTAAWIYGRHIVFVESQDVAGNWGVPSAAFVWIGYRAYLPIVAHPK